MAKTKRVSHIETVRFMGPKAAPLVVPVRLSIEEIRALSDIGTKRRAPEDEIEEPFKYPEFKPAVEAALAVLQSRLLTTDEVIKTRLEGMDLPDRIVKLERLVKAYHAMQVFHAAGKFRMMPAILRRLRVEFDIVIAALTFHVKAKHDCRINYGSRNGDNVADPSMSVEFAGDHRYAITRCDGDPREDEIWLGVGVCAVPVSPQDVREYFDVLPGTFVSLFEERKDLLELADAHVSILRKHCGVSDSEAALLLPCLKRSLARRRFLTYGSRLQPQDAFPAWSDTLFLGRPHSEAQLAARESGIPHERLIVPRLRVDAHFDGTKLTLTETILDEEQAIKFKKSPRK